MFSRRSFFGVTAGAAATSLASVGARPAAAAPGGPTLKVGLASYSLRKLPVEKVIETCKAAGVKYVNLKDMHLSRKDPAETVKANADKIREAGLTIMGGGTISWKLEESQPIDAAFEESVRKDFAYAKAAGFPLMVITLPARGLDVVEKMVKEFDIKVAIHNHGPEDKHYPAPQDALKHIKKRDKRMGLCMDIGHTLRAGADPAKTAIECGPRLLDLHVKDLVKKTPAEMKPDEKNPWKQVEVGRGQMDITALFKALLRIRYAGHLGLEYEINEADPVAGVLESLAYMKGVAAGLGALSSTREA